MRLKTKLPFVEKSLPPPESYKSQLYDLIGAALDCEALYEDLDELEREVLRGKDFNQAGQKAKDLEAGS